VGRDETRRQMTALVRRWEGSDETQAAFAQRHGLSQGKLRYWVQRLPPLLAAPVTFTPVQLRDDGRPAAGGIEVSLATGERLVIAADASADLVRAVVAAVRAPC
jgi:hypothetical protein